MGRGHPGPPQGHVLHHPLGGGVLAGADQGGRDERGARGQHVVGVRPLRQPGQSNYGAAKSGIASFSVIVAKELARYGVTVNAIAPGARTRMTLSVPRPGAAAPAEVPADEFDRRDPANVAPLVVWLGGSTSGEVTGQVFNVAGGMIGVAENWRRGPSRDKGDRWSPAEVGDVVPALLAEV